MKSLASKTVTGLCLSLLTGTSPFCQFASAATHAAERSAFSRAEAAVSAPRHGQSRVSYHSSLDQKVVAHSDAANARDLIGFLAPRGWRVRFDVAAARVDRTLVFHAETTRRHALDQLCASLGLKGIFYPRKRLVLIVEGRRPS